MFSKVDIESLWSTWDEVTPITAWIGHWLTVGAKYQVKRERPKITHFLFTRSLRAPPILIETVLTRFLCSTTICYYEWFYPVEQLPLFRWLPSMGPSLFQWLLADRLFCSMRVCARFTHRLVIWVLEPSAASSLTLMNAASISKVEWKHKELPVGANYSHVY